MIFPRLEVTGAALTSLISLSLALRLTVVVLSGRQSRLQLTLRHSGTDFSTVWRIAPIGTPASITGVQRSLSNLVLTWFMVPFGTLAVAGHTVIRQRNSEKTLTGPDPLVSFRP